MKVNKTAVIVSVIIGVVSFLFAHPFIPDEEEFGIWIFCSSLVLLHIKPELMGNLYKPDDGEKKEEDT